MNIAASKLSGILVILLVMFSSTSGAQHVGGNPGPCPGGSAPVNGSCGSPSNANPGKKAPLPEVWRDRYGALAASEHGSVIGVAQDQRSERAARKMAMKKCVGPACRIVVEFRNACGSAAWGDGNSGRMAYGAEPSSGSAEQKALGKCRAAGGGECETIITTCSLPVRVQ